jgi:hypothetical protein
MTYTSNILYHNKRIKKRIALRLMQSSHVQTLEVIGGVPLLRLKFSMLNHKYLIWGFLTARHRLGKLLSMLLGLNFTKMVRRFGVVDDYDLEPVHSVYNYPL